jgi:hypothetical protein
LFKFGNCAGHGRCWNSPSCSSARDWRVPAVWMRTLLFGKLHRCSEITSGSWDAPDNPTCLKYSLAVFRP